MEEFIAIYILLTIGFSFFIPRRKGHFYIAPLLLAAVPALFQAGKGLRQKYLAKKLKESKFVPSELRENQALAKQQAYSRRAPGTALAEENIRRNLATTLGSQSRMFGGDAGKMVSAGAGAQARADNAGRGVMAQGQAFSENAFARLGGANNAVAGQKRQNRDEFNRAKSALLQAGDQNIFSGISNAASAGLASYLSGDIGGAGNPYKGNPAQMTNPMSQYLYGNNFRYGANGMSVWNSPGFQSGFNPNPLMNGGGFPNNFINN